VEALLFFLGCETWKWAKRIFFRRRAKKLGFTPDDMEKLAFAEFFEEESVSEELREK
jgi:Na+-exporting ATPase